MITIENSEAILLKDAFATNDNCAMVLIGADNPYQIEQANQYFSTMFGFGLSEVIGKTMDLIKGPRTDILGWCTLFQTALEGKAIRGTLNLMTGLRAEIEAILSCIPVVEFPNAKIKHVLVRFEAAPPTAHGGFGSSLPFRPISAPHTLPADQDDSEQRSQRSGRRGEESPPLLQTQIYPRRKASDPQQRDAPLAPVTLTLEVLDSLADVPLYRAAEKLGVSATALKLACRKLGVRKWLCRREPPGPSGGAASGARSTDEDVPTPAGRPAAAAAAYTPGARAEAHRPSERSPPPTGAGERPRLSPKPPSAPVPPAGWFGPAPEKRPRLDAEAAFGFALEPVCSPSARARPGPVGGGRGPPLLLSPAAADPCPHPPPLSPAAAGAVMHPQLEVPEVLNDSDLWGTAAAAAGAARAGPSALARRQDLQPPPYRQQPSVADWAALWAGAPEEAGPGPADLGGCETGFGLDGPRAAYTPGRPGPPRQGFGRGL